MEFFRDMCEKIVIEMMKKGAVNIAFNLYFDKDNEYLVSFKTLNGETITMPITKQEFQGFVVWSATKGKE